MNLRKAISIVRNSLKAMGLDDWIPAKFIHSKYTEITALFLKREADDKRLQQYYNIWLPVNVSMKEVPLISVANVNIPNCKTVMISKELPPIFSTRYGYLIKVSSLDFGKDYLPTTPEAFKYKMSREFIDPNKRYFWMSGRKIVTPYPVKELIVRAIWVDQALAKKVDTNYDNDCILMMDEEVSVPEHLYNDISNAITLQIMNSVKRITGDESPNLNNNEK